jgi:3-hydroxyisobutyrate dehydrogenase-like beta-hydroxyacid dehydrogenase
MGFPMANNLKKSGFEVTAFDLNEAQVKKATEEVRYRVK